MYRPARVGVLLLIAALTMLGLAVPASAAPVAPTCLTAVAGAGTRTVVLDWDDVPGATSYKVWEDLFSPPAHVVTTVTASTRTSGTVAAGDYRYYVTAVDSSGESVASPALPVTVPVVGTVSSPSGCDPNAAPAQSNLRPDSQPGVDGDFGVQNPITAGQQLKFNGNWCVENADSPANEIVSWQIDGVQVGSAAYVPKAVGCYGSLSNQSWTATEGTHTLTIVFDPSNTIPESNEADNTSSRTITVGPAAPTDVPAAPVLTASVNASNQVVLDWNDVSGAASYEIHEDLYAADHVVATVTTSNSTRGPLADGTYRYFVKSLNSSGASAASNAMTCPVPGGPCTSSAGGGGGTPSAPVAGFTANPSSGNAPLAVQFTDTSTGSPTSWSWNFGDGGTSTARNPSHTFQAAGTYTVTLTATNAGGSSTATETVTASSPPAGDGRAPQIPASATEVWSGDYDTGNLSQWQTCQNKAVNGSCGTATSYGSYSVQVLSAGAHEGSHAARFEVRDGDVPSFGGGERSEVSSNASGATVSDGDELYYQFSLKFDSTFDCGDVGSFFIVQQWHPGSGSPSAALTVDSSCNLRLSNLNGATDIHKTIGNIKKGQWVDYVLHAKFTTSSSTGWAEVWQDGVKVLPQAAMALMADASSYLKQGIYRTGGASSTAIVWHDGLTVYRP